MSQVGYALKWLIPTLIFSGAIIGVMYWSLGYAEVATTQLTGRFIEEAAFKIGQNYSLYCLNDNDVSRATIENSGKEGFKYLPSTPPHPPPPTTTKTLKKI
jgi:hypothetical protein